MELLCLPAKKSAVSSLNSDSEKVFAPPAFGEGLPLSVGIVSQIVSPTGQRVFDPLSWSGWTSPKAAVGKGYVPPVAGSFYLESGIALTAGVVVTGKRYRIMAFIAGDDFTNIGAGSNATGVTFTASGTTPTTWTNASELQEITGNIAFDAVAATIQTALNATAWVTAQGGLTVSSEGALYFFFTWTTAGDRPQINGFAENLEPLSIVETGTLIDGDTGEGLQEVQTLRVFQNAGAFIDLTDDATTAAVTITPVTVGGAGLNAKYRVNLTPLAPALYDGAFSLIVRGIESAMIAFDASGDDAQAAVEGIQVTSGLLTNTGKYKIVAFVAGDDFANIGGTNVTGNVFTATGTTPTTWTHGSTVSPVGAGNVSVTLETAGQYLIVFKGDMANTDMGTITGDPAALRIVPYKLGTLSFNTPGMELLLGSADSVACFLVVTAIPPGETLPQELLRVDCIVNAAVLDPASETPPNRIDFWSKTEADARFAFKTVAAKYRFKADGTVELWNPDQNLFHPLTIAGAAGAEILNIGAGEA